MTPPKPKTCQRCHRPAITPITLLRAPEEPLAVRSLAQVCPLCYMQLLAFLNENLEVVDARKSAGES
mgnify:CR=1 FL=1